VITELNFGQPTVRTTANHWMRSRAFLVALVAHTALIIALITAQRMHPRRLGTEASQPTTGIGAFISPGPAVGTTGTKPVEKKVPAPEKAPKKTAPSTEATQERAGAADNAAAGAGNGSQVGGGGTGPIRIGSGQGLSLLKRVEPVYPPAMQAARVEGTVVLDATIGRDGSVGDVKVLKSSGPMFERAAVEAVKQWRYSPIPFEGLLTVTVNFTLR
jgi:TonB family protein